MAIRAPDGAKKIRRLPFRPDDLGAKPGRKGLEDESVVAFSVNLIAKFHPDDFQDSRSLL